MVAEESQKRRLTRRSGEGVGACPTSTARPPRATPRPPPTRSPNGAVAPNVTAPTPNANADVPSTGTVARAFPNCSPRPATTRRPVDSHGRRPNPTTAATPADPASRPPTLLRVPARLPDPATPMSPPRRHEAARARQRWARADVPSSGPSGQAPVSSVPRAVPIEPMSLPFRRGPHLVVVFASPGRRVRPVLRRRPSRRAPRPRLPTPSARGRRSRVHARPRLRSPRRRHVLRIPEGHRNPAGHACADRGPSPKRGRRGAVPPTRGRSGNGPTTSLDFVARSEPPGLPLRLPPPVALAARRRAVRCRAARRRVARVRRPHRVGAHRNIPVRTRSRSGTFVSSRVPDVPRWPGARPGSPTGRHHPDAAHHACRPVRPGQ